MTDAEYFASRVTTQFQIECDECGCGLTTEGKTLDEAIKGFLDSGYYVARETGGPYIMHYILCGRCAETEQKEKQCQP